MSTGKTGYLVLGIVLLILGLLLLCSWAVMLEEATVTPTPIRLIPDITLR